jgi:16S rRNA (cytidine1402-2'-O)-methyltransferase
VVAGATAAPVELDAVELAAAVAAEEAAGATRKDAIRAVVVRTGLPKRTVYDAVVAAKTP